VASQSELARVLSTAATEARAAGRLNVISLEAPNGNSISFVVGADETVLGFRFGHGNPPYLASRGESSEDEPLMTAYVSLKHHTEFPRRNVVPYAVGYEAAVEFLRTGDLPQSVQWIEL
jgi:hypothetical protein